ncbi:MAG TPA: NAD(P)-dependent oxidoreductase [Spirochaetota bacterium]|nr:NAD(P)-dependent oxidoreductase [Spirochaetota bacterium]
MVLVTGCNSLVGNTLVRRLLADGVQVRAIDTWREKGLPESVDFLQGSVLDEELLLSACEGVKTVFHFKDIESPVHDGRRRMKKVNIRGTENVLKAAKENDVRKVIFLSTAEVYGNRKTMLIKEDDAKKPVTPYGKDKLKAEKLCVRAVETDNMDITIFRPTIVGGAGIEDPLILVILYMAMAVGDANRLYIAGDGNTRFQLVHPSDVVDAMLTATKLHETRGKIYNLGSDDVPTQMEQLVKVKEKARLDCQIKHISPSFAKISSVLLKPLKINYLRKEHVMFLTSNFVLDCDQAKKELNWNPTKDNIEILLEAIRWYEKEKL